jgi:putative transposase
MPDFVNRRLPSVPPIVRPLINIGKVDLNVGTVANTRTTRKVATPLPAKRPTQVRGKPPDVHRGITATRRDIIHDGRVGNTPDQIIRKLAEGHKLLAAGKDLDEVCRHLEIAESTWHRWLAQYGGMKANDAKRLKELEAENARLKKLLAEAELDKSMLKELAEGNF